MEKSTIITEYCPYCEDEVEIVTLALLLLQVGALKVIFPSPTVTVPVLVEAVPVPVF